MPKLKEPMDPAVIKKRVLEEPATAKIADELGISVDEYADQVVHFLMNPDAEPDLAVMSDADLARDDGYVPPRIEAVEGYVKELIAIQDVAENRTEFTHGKKARVALNPAPTGEVPSADAEAAEREDWQDEITDRKRPTKV